MVTFPKNTPAPRLPRANRAIVVRETPHGVTLAKWPRKRSRNISAGDSYRQTEFGIMARWTRYADDLSVRCAIEDAATGPLVPRDFLMQCMMGTAFFYEWPDGTIIEGGRVANPNFNFILDGITDVPGSMIWRGPNGWLAVAPGTPGQFLQLDANGVPAWVDAGTGIAYVAGNWTPVFSTSGAVPTGVTYGSRVARYVNFPALKLCWVECLVVLTNKGAGGTGNIRITGLPFAAENVANQNQTFGGWVAPITPGAGVPANGWELLPNGTLASPVAYGNNAGPIYVTWAQTANISRFALSGLYKTV